MADPRSKSDEYRLTNALARLGAARRERLSTDDFPVYEEELRRYPIAVVERICAEFWRRPVPEFGSRFPSLGDLVEAVQAHLKREQDARELQTKYLTDDAVVDPPKVYEFKARVLAEVERRRMR